MSLSTISAPTTEQTTPTEPVSIANTTLSSIESIHEESLNILVPLCSLLAIIILSLLVYLMASNRRRFVHKRRGRHSLHECNEYESPLEQNIGIKEEEDEVGSENNLEKSLLRGRLQINNRFENYLSTSQLNRSSELLT